MSYKDLMFNDFDNLSDKVVALNNNDLFLKDYADRITQGYYLTEDTSYVSNLGTSDSTILNLEKFWVPLESRMVKMVYSGLGYSLHTGGTNYVIITIELDGVQVYQQYSMPVYNASGSTVSIDLWSDITSISNVASGEHTMTVKAKKGNASPQVDLNGGTCFVIDIGKQSDAEA